MKNYVLAMLFAGVSQLIIPSGANATFSAKSYYADSREEHSKDPTYWNEAQNSRYQYVTPVWGGYRDYYSYRSYRRPYRYYEPYYNGSYYDRDCYY